MQASGAHQPYRRRRRHCRRCRHRLRSAADHRNTLQAPSRWWPPQPSELTKTASGALPRALRQVGGSAAGERGSSEGLFGL